MEQEEENEAERAAPWRQALSDVVNIWRQEGERKSQFFKVQLSTL